MAEKDSLSAFDRDTALALAIISGGFSLAVIVALCWYGLAYAYPRYLDDPGMISLRKLVLEHPDNATLKELYRKTDLLRRQAYFEAQSRLRSGGYLLFGSLVVFALSMRRLAKLSEKAPVPPVLTDDSQRERRLAAGGICAVSALAVAAAALILIWTRPPAPQTTPTEGLPVPPLVLVDGGEKPVPEALRWPQLRGTNRLGIVEAMDLPLSWNAANGKNILWKAKLPLPGNSSPVIWGDRVFLTGADHEVRQVFCLNRKDGALLWNTSIKTAAVLPPDFQIWEDTGLAAPTPVTDGKRIFAFFGTNELAALDLTGRQLWARWFGKPESMYGTASSPLLYENKLILQLDQGGPEEGKSFLYALDPASGKELWKAPRDVPSSWSSPIIAETPNGPELITCGNPWVISYDPKTGYELWRARVLPGDAAPLPTYANGLVYTLTGYTPLTAIKTGGVGDVTDKNVVWTYSEDISDVSSPVTDGTFFLFASSTGSLTCLDAKTGKLLWREQFEASFWSSPTLVGRLVYLTDREGKTYIFELAGRYKLLGTGELGELVVATPAFVDSKIYIRGRDHLYCIGQKDVQGTDKH